MLTTMSLLFRLFRQRVNSWKRLHNQVTNTLIVFGSKKKSQVSDNNTSSNDGAISPLSLS